jgi:hypothetical protein
VSASAWRFAFKIVSGSISCDMISRMTIIPWILEFCVHVNVVLVNSPGKLEKYYPLARQWHKVSAIQVANSWGPLGLQRKYLVRGSVRSDFSWHVCQSNFPGQIFQWEAISPWHSSQSKFPGTFSRVRCSYMARGHEEGTVWSSHLEEPRTTLSGRHVMFLGEQWWWDVNSGSSVPSQHQRCWVCNLHFLHQLWWSLEQ